MWSLMQIETKRQRDRDVFHKDPNVNGVVDLLLKDKSSIFDEVIFLVNSACTYPAYKNQIQDIKDILSDDPHALEVFNEYCYFLESIYTAESGTCGNLRGALLERLIYKALEHKYDAQGKKLDKYTIFTTNCYIMVESWKSNKTIDVFYYSRKKFKGETFECKVNPNEIECEHIENLNDIYHQSEYSINPSIACFSKKEAIEQDMRDKNIPTGIITLLGFDELKSLTPEYGQIIKM